MTEHRFFKMRAGGGGYEYYVVIDDKYFFWDCSCGEWWEGFYKTWQTKLERDVDISETTELEILILAGKEMIDAVKQFSIERVRYRREGGGWKSFSTRG